MHSSEVKGASVMKLKLRTYVRGLKAKRAAQAAARNLSIRSSRQRPYRARVPRRDSVTTDTRKVPSVSPKIENSAPQITWKAAVATDSSCTNRECRWMEVSTERT